MTLPSFSRSRRVFGQALAGTLSADELKALNGAVFRVPGVIRDSDAVRLAAQATRRSASTCRNHWPSWFQLVKMRLTIHTVDQLRRSRFCGRKNLRVVRSSEICGSRSVTQKARPRRQSRSVSRSEIRTVNIGESVPTVGH